MTTNGAQGGDLDAPTGATNAVLMPSDPVPDGAVPVKGIEFDDYQGRNMTVPELLNGMAQMGFQASSIGQAAQIVDGMVSKSCRASAISGAQC